MRLRLSSGSCFHCHSILLIPTSGKAPQQDATVPHSRDNHNDWLTRSIYSGKSNMAAAPFQCDTGRNIMTNHLISSYFEYLHSAWPQEVSGIGSFAACHVKSCRTWAIKWEKSLWKSQICSNSKECSRWTAVELNQFEIRWPCLFLHQYKHGATFVALVTCFWPCWRAVHSVVP